MSRFDDILTEILGNPLRQKARLDSAGTAKPRTKILGHYPPKKEGWYNSSERIRYEYVDTPDPWEVIVLTDQQRKDLYLRASKVDEVSGGPDCLELDDEDI